MVSRFHSVPRDPAPAGDWPAPVLASHQTPAGTWHDTSGPGRLLEEFVVASSDDHLRRHERRDQREQAHLERVRELTDSDHPVHRHPLARRQLAQGTCG